MTPTTDCQFCGRDMRTYDVRLGDGTPLKACAPCLRVHRLHRFEPRDEERRVEEHSVGDRVRILAIDATWKVVGLPRPGWIEVECEDEIVGPLSYRYEDVEEVLR